ncbi:T9SS type A sorting domain-containing protein [Pseudoflavitalea sp. X16]|uniref:rhamnogalacturonan lyase family protein n=1 Tax=Paraflavitalea devenefica TaxID=2716334 RepID=UPI001422A932|nr:carbohydrate-binding protein [Paraflavitalea devenefica]NII25275.1 T9SS type A sorting domain-containing protein [Paraflavitalea devenefica]
MKCSLLCATRGISLRPGQHRFARLLSRKLSFFLCCLLISCALHAQYQMEYLGRGVVAVRTSSSQVYVGWRMLGTDPSGIAFNVYRGATKINVSPITGSTNVVDNVSTNDTYTVRPVIGGVEQTASAGAGVTTQTYLNVPLQIPAGGTTPSGEAYTYTANDASVGDLDGDGEYEIILKWDPTNAKDNSQSGYTGNVYIDAYKLNGTRLWRIDLGRNIRAGAHYTQFLVYDFDGDGKAEMACKTADATRDGAGTYIGSSSADYRNSSGYVLTGPEFLTVFNGQTGAAMATTNYLPARGTVSSWGDNYGNRVDRFVANVAYLDGQRPSMVFGRGYYTRLVRVAWDWRNGQLTQRWNFDSNNSGNSAYAGQGNHQVSVADIDGDGRQETINGSSAINDNGTGSWANGMGHGDALHVSDMDPDRAGLEIWQPYESPGSNGQVGAALVNAANGARLWTVAEASADVGRGLAADIDPRYKGYECWASRGGLYTCKGVQITTTKPSINFAVWWDADLSRELLDGTTISKWNYSSSSVSTLLSASGTASNNSTKATPALSADVLGDWREEVILRASDNSALRIYTTTILATNRIYTLMHDPQYRMAIAWQNTAYNQPPHPGFYLGTDMSAPPTPNIVMVGAPPPSGNSITIQENTTGFCSVDGTVDNNNAGFTGTGFANGNNAANAGVNWRITTPAAGSYNLNWRYSNGGGADRPARLLVNGSTAVASIGFPATANWTTWTNVSTNVSLPAGTVNLRLEGINATGPANIDNLVITGNNPAAVSCTGARIALSDVHAADERIRIAVYPNPSPTVFFLTAPGAFHYEAYDATGRLIEKGKGQNKVQVGTAWGAGWYLVKIIHNDKTISTKVTKQ